MAISDGHEEAESSMEVSGTHSASQRKILVVEVDLAGMKLANVILQQHGYSVLQASEANEGIPMKVFLIRWAGTPTATGVRDFHGLLWRFSPWVFA